MNKETSIFISQFKDYINELSVYDTDLKTLTDQDKDSWIRKFMYNPCYSIYIVKEENIQVGFFIIATGQCCHPDADYFIYQTYIDKEHRRMGIGKSELTQFIKENPGTYCLDIINGNKPSELFWDSVFRSINATKISIKDIRQSKNLTNLKLIAYKT